MRCSVLLALLLLTAPAHAARGDIERIETLPIEGLDKVITKDGEVYFISRDRRFLFLGEMRDLWSGEQVTAAAIVDRIDLSRTGVTVPEMGVQVTASEPQHVLFVALSCSRCVEILPEVIEHSRTLAVPLGIALLDRTSADRAANRAIWCADDPGQALTDFLAGQALPTPSSTCLATQPALATAFATTFQLPALPALLRSSGELEVVSAKDAETIIQQIHTKEREP